MKYVVYAIVDPRSQAPFYIGESGSFTRRCRQHLKGTDQISGLVIRQLKENGFVPHFVILERHAEEETALRAEIFWIETMLGRGVDLVNAQAFEGFHGRQSKRRNETSKLANMKRLRAIANGRTSRRTRPNRTTQDADGWSPADLKRLRGMNRSGLAVGVMAKMLERSVDDVRTKLARDLLL